MFEESKRLYWRQIRKERGTRWNRGGEYCQKRWTEYFEKLMNVYSGGTLIKHQY